ncbi:ATP-binding protein [Streptomyces hydrogenans]|uniref:ATP-binding protein n=1 Tax=Streptomyces hydrogenans TaxID=1873719 RepID=UPI0035E3966D
MAVAWELAANAVQHALKADAQLQQPGRAWLLRRGEAVACAVTDASPAPPRLGPPDPMDSNRRGLHLVDRISSHWGWSNSPSGTKTVWAKVLATW